MDGPGQSLTIMDEKKPVAERAPIRVLLLDDHVDNLILRSAILRKHGYQAIKAATIEEAEAHLHEADIAVLDYHLGAGQFGTEVASTLREKRPQVPKIGRASCRERGESAVVAV